MSTEVRTKAPNIWPEPLERPIPPSGDPGEDNQLTCLIQEIQAALTQQRSGSQEIVSSLVEMKDLTHQVRSGAREMEEGNRQILEATTNLKEITEEVKQAIRRWKKAHPASWSPS